MMLSDTAQLLGNLGEFFGAIAVAVTLIYVAAQIRQNGNSIQGSAKTDAARQRMEWHARITNDVRLQRLYAKAAVHEQMTREDATTYIWLQAEYYYLSEGWYRLYRRGLMTEDTWLPLADTAVGVLQNPYVREWWDQASAPLSNDFRRYINNRREQNSGQWRLVDTDSLISTVGGV
jgi:hypothetical protein